MNVLAMETATETVGVAVRTTGGVQAEFTLTGRRRHVESLTPAMEHLLGQVGLEPGDLQAVSVDIGPGLFTGLRVGVASAKGLAQALGIGVFRFTSLDILVRAAAHAGHRGHVLAVVDARRGEVFATLHHVDQAGASSEVLAPGLFAPDELASAVRSLGGVAVLAVGDGAQRYADALAAVPGLSPVRGTSTLLSASTQLDLVAAAQREGITPVGPGEVVPLYMREADAKSNFAQIRRG
jgi:tRNA threonylcarbamoyladenosine biosynthesis protein TsaB